LKKIVRFGNRTILLRGGYFLKPRLQNLALPEIQARIQELDPASGQTAAPMPAGEMSRLLALNDYKGKPVLAILLIASQAELNRQKARLISNSITFIVVTFLICLITGYLLSLWISRPVARLQSAAEEMSRGNLAVRVAEGGSGEIAALMTAFNQMAEQLQEKQEKLVQSERIAAWEEIARHLAHEIKNPLTPIRTSLTHLRLCLEKAPEKFSEIFLESSENITEEVEKLRHLADEFSKFARLPALSLRPANVNEVVQKAILLHQPGTPNGIVFEPGEVPVFYFDPDQISQVLHNLLKNATEAIGHDGMIKVATGTVQSQGKRWVFLVVEDNGAGMEEHVRRQMFTPYFTTKDKGTGLGLAIVHRIVYEHGGSILIDSAPGKGTKFEVRLPADKIMNAE
jgi:nitrogen fixation/metabolism regulation signal transduction histidine kinase